MSTVEGWWKVESVSDKFCRSLTLALLAIARSVWTADREKGHETGRG